MSVDIEEIALPNPSLADNDDKKKKKNEEEEEHRLAKPFVFPKGFEKTEAFSLQDMIECAESFFGFGCVRAPKTKSKRSQYSNVKDTIRTWIYTRIRGKDCSRDSEAQKARARYSRETVQNFFEDPKVQDHFWHVSEEYHYNRLEKAHKKRQKAEESEDTPAKEDIDEIINTMRKAAEGVATKEKAEAIIEAMRRGAEIIAAEKKADIIATENKLDKVRKELKRLKDSDRQKEFDAFRKRQSEAMEKEFDALDESTTSRQFCRYKMNCEDVTDCPYKDDGTGVKKCPYKKDDTDPGDCPYMKDCTDGRYCPDKDVCPYRAEIRLIQEQERKRFKEDLLFNQLFDTFFEFYAVEFDDDVEQCFMLTDDPLTPTDQQFWASIRREDPTCYYREKFSLEKLADSLDELTKKVDKLRKDVSALKELCTANKDSTSKSIF